MSVQKKIERALFARVTTAAAAVLADGIIVGHDLVPHSDGAPFSDGTYYSQYRYAAALPIAWPNVDFTPPPTPYLRVDVLRNRPERLFMKGSAPHLRQGILQLTLVSAFDLGTDFLTDVADRLANQFPADLAMFESGVKVRVQEDPTVVTGEKTDATWDTRVDVYYESLS